MISSEIADNIAPVVIIEPYQNIVRSVNSLATIFTTPSDKDFYLTSAILSVAKDAAATGTSVTITAIIDGVTQTIVAVAGITLTANAQTVNEQCYVKIDRNTAIAISGANWTVYRGIIKGFTVEVTR